jgi:hypothetical protein
MADVYDEIRAEREYQTNKWGVEADDTANTPNDWVAYIAHHASRWFKGGFLPVKGGSVDDFRTQMIKTAALAVAAVESLDRQRAANGTAFYESAE